MALTGSNTCEISAPIQRCYEVAADPENSGEWQPEIKNAKVLERNDAGEQILVDMQSDLRVKTVDLQMRFDYNPPTGLTWTQLKGPLKSVEGRWEFEDLGDGRTRATCTMDIDLGRMGFVIRGPLVGVLRGALIESMPEKLKKYCEANPA